MTFFKNVWAVICGFFRLLNAFLLALIRGMAELEKALTKVEASAREYREKESVRLEKEYEELVSRTEARKSKEVIDSKKMTS